MTRKNETHLTIYFPTNYGKSDAYCRSEVWHLLRIWQWGSLARFRNIVIKAWD